MYKQQIWEINGLYSDGNFLENTYFSRPPFAHSFTQAPTHSTSICQASTRHRAMYEALVGSCAWRVPRLAGRLGSNRSMICGVGRHNSPHIRHSRITELRAGADIRKIRQSFPDRLAGRALQWTGPAKEGSPAGERAPLDSQDVHSVGSQSR